MKISTLILLLIAFHLPAVLARACDESVLLPKGELRWQHARRLGLTQSEDSDFTIRRLRRGQNFIYENKAGDPITNKKTLERIAAVKIRPDLREVRISDDPRGHIQAIGFDESRRTQYAYHPMWDQVRKTVKFETTLPAFAEAIPDIREAVARDLRGALTERRMIAGIVRLLDETLIRIGNKEYAVQNKSYGLTTLLKSHVKVSGNKISFSFPGKSGVYHEVEYSNGPVAKLVRELLSQAGRALFTEVDSDSVNEYLKEITNTDFTAKDFRTWGGTVAALEYLNSIAYPSSEKEFDKAFAAAARATAEELENTPSVSRASYIHPKIFELYKNDHAAFHSAFAKAQRRIERAPTGRTLAEEALFVMLNEGV